MNTLKTTLLLATLTGILIAAGQALGGNQGAILALILAGVMNFVSYWFSDRIVLASYRAVPAQGAPGGDRLIRVIERLAMTAGQPVPRVYIIPSPTPNAFATGRDPEHAAVAATAGILDLLDDEELEGVLAHELAHVRHRDILTGSIVATIAGAISLLAQMAHLTALFGGGRRDDRGAGGAIGLLVTALVAPIAAMIIQMAISRGREFAADAGGGGADAPPARSCAGAGKTRDHGATSPARGESGFSAPLHFEPAPRRRDREPLYHPSAGCRARAPA